MKENKQTASRVDCNEFTAREAVCYAQRATLYAGLRCDLRGADHHPLPGFAFGLLVVHSGNAPDRVRDLVYPLLLSRLRNGIPSGQIVRTTEDFAFAYVRRGKERGMKIYIIKMPRFLAKLLERWREWE